MKRELTVFAALLAIFLVAYFLNLSSPPIQEAILEAFRMLQWYARNHTLACVVPAMFIAGGIATFLSKEAVLRHLGPKANKLGAYTVASVSGTVLAVCSCSVLPMFAGIYRVGAGLGPASAFLYSGPAINVMAIFLTARVLGFDIGLARVIGSVGFAYLIGLLMAVIFRKEEQVREAAMMQLPDPPPSRRTLLQTSLYFASMILFLVFSDWADPSETVLHFKDGTQRVVSVLEETTDKYRIQYSEQAGDHKVTKKEWIDKSDLAEHGKQQHVREGYQWAAAIYNLRWYFAGGCLVALALMLWRWFGREELGEWMGQTWGFAKTIIPLLFGGVFITGFVSELLPEKAVAAWVGGNGIVANFMASLIGAMWYFATLTEIPILEALFGLGMGRGPGLALLLAGPALSVPSIAVIYQVIGFKKTAVFVALVVVLSTVAGMIFGSVMG
jgi:uncharacterized membrane protein YraQ (UPF0718 family)